MIWASTALVAIVLAILSLLVWQAYYDRLEQSEVRTRTAAANLGSHLRWMLGSSIVTLHQAASGGEPSSELASQIESLLEVNIGFRTDVALFDRDGMRSPGTNAQIPENIVRSEVFRELVAGRPWVIGRENAKEPLLVAARRTDRDGGFAGAVVMAVPASATMSSLWEPSELRQGAKLGILRTDGRILAWQPEGKEDASLTELPALDLLNAAEAGTYTSSSSPINGVASFIGFNHVPELGLIAIASLPRGEVLASLWRATGTVLLLLSPIALVLMAGAFLTARLLRTSSRTQKGLASALAQNEVLLREIHHRVKNNLQSVASLLKLQPIPSEIKRDMSLRIAAMADVHELIYRSNDFSMVPMKDYLTKLTHDIKASRDESPILKIDIDELSLDKDTAIAVGLIVNEVVTNAFKHAFRDGRPGVLRVALVRTGTDRVRLTVQDNGVGFDPDQPASGIGRKLIAALAKQIGGKPEYSSPIGSRFDLEFPMPSTAPAN